MLDSLDKIHNQHTLAPPLCVYARHFIFFIFLFSFVCDIFDTELKGELGWTRFGLARTFSLSTNVVKDTCERINYLDVDEQSFIERYESPAIPVVITDSQLEWQASKKWTMEVGIEVLTL